MLNDVTGLEKTYLMFKNLDRKNNEWPIQQYIYKIWIMIKYILDKVIGRRSNNLIENIF